MLTLPMISVTTTKSPGRSRDLRAMEAIFQATRELLLERGYPDLTIEGVAHRAKVGKSTIYRWWPSKQSLVLDAAAKELHFGDVPDTGNTRQDLISGIDQLTRTFSNPVAGAVISAAIAHVERDPTLTRNFRNRWVTPWLQSFSAALERGIARGDLPRGLDVLFTGDLVLGLVFKRTLTHENPETEGLTAGLVDFLLNGRLPTRA